MLTPHQVGARLGFGPLPVDCTLMHDCEVRLCCSSAPGHVRIATQRENMRQAVARGRSRGPRPGLVDTRGVVGASRAIQAAIVSAVQADPGIGKAALAAVLAAAVAAGDPLRHLCRCSTRHRRCRSRGRMTSRSICSTPAPRRSGRFQRCTPRHCSTWKPERRDAATPEGPATRRSSCWPWSICSGWSGGGSLRVVPGVVGLVGVGRIAASRFGWRLIVGGVVDNHLLHLGQDVTQCLQVPQVPGAGR